MRFPFLPRNLPHLLALLIFLANRPSTSIGQNVGLTPVATTVQLPTFGVSIDAAGVVTVRTFNDPTGTRRAAHMAEARATLPTDVQTPAPLRKVSLVRLERAWRKRVEAGAAPDDVMRHLAGLTSVRFALLLPAGDSSNGGDVVLAGEAEGWCDDGLGRAIGLKTGRPVLRLDDLQTALAAYLGDDPASAGFVGCTIDPTVEGLERMRRLRAEIPRTIRDDEQAPFAAQLDRRTREALGHAAVRVFGVAADTHLAAVLVEADYRMKRIAVGVELPPLRLPSYVDRATGAPASALQRYWFVPDYARLQTDAARQSLEFLGRGLRLQTEDVALGDPASAAAGKLQTSPSRDPAATSFCADFTKRYDDIAARSPAFAELRTMVDLLVAAAFMRQHDWPKRANWRPTRLVDRKHPVFAPATSPQPVAPQSAAVVVNTVWKGRRMISAAGGGVSITPAEALRPEHLREVDAKQFEESRRTAASPTPNDRWWWD
jgi:hypothetical protein